MVTPHIVLTRRVRWVPMFLQFGKWDYKPSSTWGMRSAAIAGSGAEGGAGQGSGEVGRVIYWVPRIHPAGSHVPNHADTFLTGRVWRRHDDPILTQLDDRP